MDQPCRGTTREQLLKKYRNRIFYHLKTTRKGYGDLSIKPCILARDCAWDVDLPLIRCFDDEMNLMSYSQFAHWEELYENWNDVGDILYNHVFSNFYPEISWQSMVEKIWTGDDDQDSLDYSNF